MVSGLVHLCLRDLGVGWSGSLSCHGSRDGLGPGLYRPGENGSRRSCDHGCLGGIRRRGVHGHGHFGVCAKTDLAKRVI